VLPPFVWTPFKSQADAVVGFIVGRMADAGATGCGPGAMPARAAITSAQEVDAAVTVADAYSGRLGFSNPRCRSQSNAESRTKAAFCLRGVNLFDLPQTYTRPAGRSLYSINSIQKPAGPLCLAALSYPADREDATVVANW
jgi:hypothetical protein